MGWVGSVRMTSAMNGSAAVPSSAKSQAGPTPYGSTGVKQIMQEAKTSDTDYPQGVRHRAGQKSSHDQASRAWEVVALTSTFVVLIVKSFVLLAMNVIALVIPPAEKTIHGKRILVTGSGQNLGRELCLQLGRMGAKLILLDLNKEENDKTAAMVRRDGGEAHPYTCDVSDFKSLAAVAAKIKMEVGHPDFVFNNAGTYEHKPFLETTPDEIRRMINVNLLGNIWVTREFLGHMMEHNSGHVVCISSVLGFMGRTNVVPYCASKFGVKGFSEALSEELRMERRSGVYVTAVHPFLISNVEDVKPNLKFPWLFEILDCEEAASKIIQGVRRNQEEMFLPGRLQPIMHLSRALPRKLRRLFSDYMET